MNALEEQLAALLQLRAEARIAPEEGLRRAIRQAADALPADAPAVCHVLAEEARRAADGAVPAPPDWLARPPAGRVPDGPPIGAGDQLQLPGLPGVGLEGNGLKDFAERLLRGFARMLALERPHHGFPQDAIRAEIDELRALGRRFPARYEPEPVAGLVERLPDTANGLIHGGVVHLAGGRRVIVRAHRFFEQDFTLKDRYRLDDVVAGVCELWRGEELEQRFHSAPALEHWFQRCDQPLPPAPCEFVHAGSTIAPFTDDIEIHAWSAARGFYRPADLVRRRRLDPLHHARARLDEPPLEDDGLPDPGYYTGRVLRQGQVSTWTRTPFLMEPGPVHSVENALFPAAAPAPGVPIDSPYCTVFVPGPGAPTALVGMVSVRRGATFQRRGPRLPRDLREYSRTSTWEVRLVGAG